MTKQRTLRTLTLRKTKTSIEETQENENELDAKNSINSEEKDERTKRY